MKKFALYSLAAMFAFSFVACDDYEEPNPEPQTNPQEAVLQASDVNVISGVVVGPYNLEAMNDAGQSIVLATVTVDNLPDGYSIQPVVTISGNDFSTSYPVEASVVEGSDNTYEIWISPDDLQGVFYSKISKSPKQKAIQARMLLQTVTGESSSQQVAYVGSSTNYYGPYTLNIVPFSSEFVIEDSYYLLGTIDDWSVVSAVKFNHSDKDVYEDPVFTLKVDISADEAAAGWWWKVIPQSTVAAGDWVEAANASYGVEVNGDDALSGVLVARTDTDDCGAGCIKEAGQWLITINMEEGTYEFSSAVDYLYTPGNSNGWSQINSQLLSTDDYANYYGYAHLNGEFKLSTAPDWDHTSYGIGAEEGELSADGGAGNLSASANGLYWITANTASLVYSTTQITSIGVIGGFNSWGGDVALTPTDDTYLVWKGTVDFDGGEWKFRMNGGWDINLGGSLQNLTQGGDNLTSDSGTYEVTLDLSQLPYSAQVVKQ